MPASNLLDHAQLYVESRGIPTPLTVLGSGTDGDVWLTQDKTAIKAFQDRIQFDREVECYSRLANRLGAENKLLGYSVPQLIDSDATLLVLEMTVVKPPYLLDFGKAYLDEKPDYPTQTWNQYLTDTKNLYGDRFKEVMSVVSALQKFGIFYYDVKPKNVMPANWNPSLDDEPEDYGDDYAG